MALAVPLSRFTSRLGGGSAFFVDCSVMKPLVITLLILSSWVTFRTSVAAPLNIGSAEPGLHIIYKSKGQSAIYLDEPDTIGSFLVGGYDERKIQVVLDRNYGLQDKIRNCKWGDSPQQLYPFDDQTAFTCEDGPDFDAAGQVSRNTQVFSTITEDLLISDDVYGLARSRYGLTTNQLFLGKIGTNIFYWETRNPHAVYYRCPGNKCNALL